MAPDPVVLVHLVSRLQLPGIYRLCGRELDALRAMVQAESMILEGQIALLVHVFVVTIVLLRVMEHPNRQPASRITWVVLVLALPVLGVLGYIMLGETNIGRRNMKAMRAAAGVRHLNSGEPVDALAEVPPEYAHLFSVGYSISGFSAVGGNRAELLPDSSATIAAIIEDIDAAQSRVDALFYIWLNDDSGRLVAEALMRAVKRGVHCRVMVDGLGSRKLLKSRLWRKMEKAGVATAAALPLGNILLRPLQGRVDLRNHRKIVVIDSRITYCGSQNCADAAFRIKAKYAPWVDAMLRLEGPVAKQNEALFAEDWAVYTREEASAVALECSKSTDEIAGDINRADDGPAVVAQVIASGPHLRYSAMPELFLSLMFRARRELVISTPYYVPNQAMQEALCAVAYRGVSTVLIVPARNDSWEVRAASHSYYEGLLQAGVQIYEYGGGLLHSKTLTLDGDITLIGSANLDRRSFDLNFENNMLIYSRELTAKVRARQQDYIDGSEHIPRDEVESWSLGRRLWNNAVAMLGPVL